MISLAFLVASAAIIAMVLAVLYRAYKGPTNADRMVAINAISTKVIVLISLLAVLTDQPTFVDIALIYAMIGFIATIALSKYVENGRLG